VQTKKVFYAPAPGLEGKRSGPESAHIFTLYPGFDLYPYTEYTVPGSGKETGR